MLYVVLVGSRVGEGIAVARRLSPLRVYVLLFFAAVGGRVCCPQSLPTRWILVGARGDNAAGRGPQLQRVPQRAPRADSEEFWGALVRLGFAAWNGRAPAIRVSHGLRGGMGRVPEGPRNTAAAAARCGANARRLPPVRSM